MKFSTKLGYRLLYYSCVVIGWLPYWFLYYVIAEVIYFLLYYVARYRVKVTRTNLENSFPERSVKERRKIERKYYRHLAEIFVDTIDLAGITPKQLKKRFIIEDEEAFRESTVGTDFIAALGHYGEWEYFMSYALGTTDRQTLGVYRPLHNEAFDLFYHKLRTRSGMTVVPMSLFLRSVIRNRAAGTNMAIGLIGDQTPPFFDIDYWYDFLNQPTPFFHGIAKTALKFGMRVYFVHIEKTSKAHYRCRLELIYDGSEQVGEVELMKRYVSRLEDMIKRRPELWMWSHRRWKFQPQPGEMEATNAKAEAR